MKTIRTRLALVCISLIITASILTIQASAKLDLKTAAGIWLLDEGKGETAKDSSENGNDGTIQGAKWVKGQVGTALSFNGTSDRVVIPDADSLDLPKAWTITAWIFVNKSENGYGHIMGKRSGAGTNYAFRTNNVGTGWDSYFNRGGWKGAWGQGVVKKDVWLYMTATYDGTGTITIYENGAKIGSAGVGGPPPVDTSEVHLGGWTANTSELLDGILDEVALFGIAITEDDMKNLMEKGIERTLGITPVETSGKLSTTWADIKVQ
ncbi:TPA: LamG domain-containing protein [Candidatus Poribacteria bacterium]|nr:LamG domain-containing protein [Candidatus Poribacteria bacterium]